MVKEGSNFELLRTSEIFDKAELLSEKSGLGLGELKEVSISLISLEAVLEPGELKLRFEGLAEHKFTDKLRTLFLRKTN